MFLSGVRRSLRKRDSRVIGSVQNDMTSVRRRQFLLNKRPAVRVMYQALCRVDLTEAVTSAVLF